MPFAALLLAATAAAPVPLAPTGPWVVHFEENLCMLRRVYPAGNQKVELIFQPLLDLDDMEVFVLSPDRSDRQYTGAYTASIEPGPRAFNGRYYSVSSPKTKARVTRLTVGRAALDQLKDGDTLRVEAKPLDLRFTILRPDKARVALQGCIDDLKKHWGIDPDPAAARVVPLGGNPAHYFGPDSYPREALSQGIYGRVIALLNINSGGTVDHCRIVSSAGAALNEGTCKAAMRIRFKPARDKDDKPIPSTYLLPVRWVVPGAPD